MRTLNNLTIIEAGDDFPPLDNAPGDAPLAIGATLSADLMLRAYRRGIFAWSSNPVTWWSPNPRAILPLDGLHISRRLARTLRQQPFRVTLDAAFESVMRGCAAPRHDDSETWLDAAFRACFAELFARGYAHSVECWRGDELVGGVLGMAVGGFFSAETMFHTATDASKVAVVHLVELLKRSGFGLLDIQVLTPHTETIGGVWIARDDYLARLREALRLKPVFRG